MFKIQPEIQTFKTDVEISVAGQSRLPVIEVEFIYKTKEQAREYFDQLKGKSDPEGLGEIIVSWKGPDQPYGADTLRAVLNNYPAAASDLYRAYSRELLESKRKNS